jgi:hypothetical protein
MAMLALLLVRQNKWKPSPKGQRAMTNIPHRLNMIELNSKAHTDGGSLLWVTVPTTVAAKALITRSSKTGCGLIPTHFVQLKAY